MGGALRRAGDLCVLTWNSQTLFMHALSRGDRAAKKIAEVRRLPALCDVLLLQETHGEAGDEHVLSQLSGNIVQASFGRHGPLGAARPHLHEDAGGRHLGLPPRGRLAAQHLCDVAP